MALIRRIGQLEFGSEVRMKIFDDSFRGIRPIAIGRNTAALSNIRLGEQTEGVARTIWTL